MQFNRRQNRIAGPGFHINVRYDDQFMAMAASTGSKANDKLKMGVTNKENFDVKEQELLVCQKESGMYHDGYTHCVSSANGFPNTDGLSSDAETLSEAILSKVKFVGVATTEYKPSKAYSEQGFVAQVGGVTTLINEGEDTIKPGDTVALGLNLRIGRKTTRDKGIPRDKIRYCLVKAKVGRAAINKALMAANVTDLAEDARKLTDAKAAADKKVKEAEDALKKAKKPNKTTAKDALDAAIVARQALDVCAGGCDSIEKFLKKYQELNERIIGKAASYARPGDRLEVILQPRNPY